MRLKMTTQADAENPIVGDIHLTGGKMTWTSDVSQEVSQIILVRFEFWVGEYFMNLQAGAPMLDNVVGAKDPDFTAIRAILANIITTTPHVSALESMTYSPDPRTRELDVVWAARLDTGTLLKSSDFGRYVVRY